MSLPNWIGRDGEDSQCGRDRKHPGAGADRPNGLRPARAALGERHRACGVVVTDFHRVSRAVLDTPGMHLDQRSAIADRAA